MCRDPPRHPASADPEVNASGIARALGAESAAIRSLDDLSALHHWIDAGAQGTFVAD
ncbi:hypothetical protein ACFVGV_20725 [Pseudarthrobacter scleromae]|uniref:hypothetical protein n=1 Tax=Pseudarthrobacter scleromae TaxID=158897 RepID=UPI003632E161